MIFVKQLLVLAFVVAVTAFAMTWIKDLFENTGWWAAGLGVLGIMAATYVVGWINGEV